MKTGLILLALTVVLGFVCEAEGQTATSEIVWKYEIAFGKQTFGIADYEWRFDMADIEPTETWTALQLGPLGEHQVPFTAWQGLVGFSFLILALNGFLLITAVRWKKKWVSR